MPISTPGLSLRWKRSRRVNWRTFRARRSVEDFARARRLPNDFSKPRNEVPEDEGPSSVFKGFVRGEVMKIFVPGFRALYDTAKGLGSGFSPGPGRRFGEIRIRARTCGQLENPCRTSREFA